MNETKPKRIDPGSLTGGIVLIVLGLLFLLDQFHVADFGDLMHRHWAMLIVLFGVAKMWRRETLWSGLWLVTVGTWLQLVTLRMYGLTYRNSWPLVLIALGAGIIVRTVVESMGRREERHDG